MTKTIVPTKWQFSINFIRFSPPVEFQREHSSASSFYCRHTILSHWRPIKAKAIANSANPKEGCWPLMRLFIALCHDVVAAARQWKLFMSRYGDWKKLIFLYCFIFIGIGTNNNNHIITVGLRHTCLSLWPFFISIVEKLVDFSPWNRPVAKIESTQYRSRIIV